MAKYSFVVETTFCTLTSVELRRVIFLELMFKLESSFLYVDTLIYRIMAENNFVNSFSLSYDAINGMKKKDLVDHIENLKGNVVVGNDIQGLFNQISKLSENVDRLVTANEKLNSELLIVRNVNQNLQNRIINLEKQQSKSEQYNRRNNVEISGISNKSQIKILNKP